MNENKKSHGFLIQGQLKELSKNFLVLIPYTWLVIFFLLPFLLIFKISASKAVVALPPFQDLVEWLSDNTLQIRVNLDNFVKIFTEPLYLDSFMLSIKIALSTTFSCLIVGYGMAYAISRVKHKWRNILMLLIILPFGTPFLIRVYAWMNVLSTKGIVNTLLMNIGLISEPLGLLDNPYAVCLGITYCYLPLMIMPIYTNLIKIENIYLEAAHDLGAGPLKTFWTITLPLSKQGIIGGCILVFMPAIGEYVIPELLGGPDTVTIGRALWIDFSANRDWPLASAMAMVIMCIFVLPIIFFQNRQRKS